MMTKLWHKMGYLSFWLGWPGLWVYLRRSSRTRILIICDNKILVVQSWLSDGKWGLPGGGLHPGENPEVGALRELFEETSLKLDVSELRALGVERLSIHGLKFLCHYYVVNVDKQLQPTLEGREITDAAWLDLSDVSQRTCGQDVRRALELLDG